MLYQDTCIAAVKEKDIEAKLKQVVNDWSAQNFQFSSFKTRGELLLKGNDVMMSHIYSVIRQGLFTSRTANDTVNYQYLKVKIYSKLLISQSKFSGPRKFTLRYQ